MGYEPQPPADARYDRRHVSIRRDKLPLADLLGTDDRSETRHDSDRILYSNYLHRLADVTQILPVDPRSPEVLLHNRLIHSMKAAQVGRTIAERFNDPRFLDPEATYAACLAHDLGHPPFGHLGEYTLDSLLRDAGLTEGYDANAQAFRIVTKLACRHPTQPGLNLTRVALNGILKYPWMLEARQMSQDKAKRSGVYWTERDDLEWAREYWPLGTPTPEATLSEWSDDITFALHDLEDFYRVGALPFSVLIDGHTLQDVVGKDASERLGLSVADLAEASRRLARVFSRPDRRDIRRPYDGSRAQAGTLRLLISELITRWLAGIRREGEELIFDAVLRAEVAFVKSFVWHYVINGPVVAEQQRDGRNVIAVAFRVMRDWMEAERDIKRLPVGLQEALLTAAAHDPYDFASRADVAQAKLRALGDYIGGLTERHLLNVVDGPGIRGLAISTGYS